MAQRISPSVFDKVDTFFIAELFLLQNYSYIEKLEELTSQLKICAETFSVYFLQRYPSGTFYMFT